jgi:hypothetical protein
MNSKLIAGGLLAFTGLPLSAVLLRNATPSRTANLARLIPIPAPQGCNFETLCLLSPSPFAGRRERDPLGAPLRSCAVHVGMRRAKLHTAGAGIGNSAWLRERGYWERERRPKLHRGSIDLG